MKYDEAQQRIEDATRDIERAENYIGETRTFDTAALMAAIAQAKLLAVIASALTEIKEAYISVNQL